MADVNTANNSNVMAGAEGSEMAGANTNQTEVKSFDEILKEGNYQADFDTKVAKAIQTALEKDKIKNDTTKSEEEKLAKMNEKEKNEYITKQKDTEIETLRAEISARNLKDEAINIATEKGLDYSLVELLDFKNIKADDLLNNINKMSETFNKAIENKVNERLKETGFKKVTSQTKTEGTDVLKNKYGKNPYFKA